MRVEAKFLISSPLTAAERRALHIPIGFSAGSYRKSETLEKERRWGGCAGGGALSRN